MATHKLVLDIKGWLAQRGVPAAVAARLAHLPEHQVHWFSSHRNRNQKPNMEVVGSLLKFLGYRMHYPFSLRETEDGRYRLDIDLKGVIGDYPLSMRKLALEADISYSQLLWPLRDDESKMSRQSRHRYNLEVVGSILAECGVRVRPPFRLEKLNQGDQENEHQPGNARPAPRSLPPRSP